MKNVNKFCKRALAHANVVDRRQCENERDWRPVHQSGDSWQQVGKIGGADDGDRGDRSRIDDEEKYPAGDEGGQRTIRLAHINIRSAGMRQHRAELRVGERAEERNQSGRHPNGQNRRDRGDLLGDGGGNHEDRASDHRPNDGCRGVEQAELPRQVFEFVDRH